MSESNEVLGATVTAVVSAAGNMMTEEHKQIAERVKDMQWVPASIVQDVIAGVSQSDPDKARILGRTVPYTMKAQLESLGATDPVMAMETMGVVRTMTSRGPDVGHVKVLSYGEGEVEVESKSLWDCTFEEGMFQGLARVFGGRNVKSTQTRCVKQGDEACVHRITWE